MKVIRTMWCLIFKSNLRLVCWMEWRNRSEQAQKCTAYHSRYTEIESKRREKEVHLESKTVQRAHMMPTGVAVRPTLHSTWNI